VLNSVFKGPSCARAYATGTGGYAAKACGTIATAGRHTPDYDPFDRCAAVQQMGTATRARYGHLGRASIRVELHSLTPDRAASVVASRGHSGSHSPSWRSCRTLIPLPRADKEEMYHSVQFHLWPCELSWVPPPQMPLRERHVGHPVVVRIDLAAVHPPDLTIERMAAVRPCRLLPRNRPVLPHREARCRSPGHATVPAGTWCRAGCPRE
jgi:hypothetical protein